jgi:hypothetical protein
MPSDTVSVTTSALKVAPNSAQKIEKVLCLADDYLFILTPVPNVQTSLSRRKVIDPKTHPAHDVAEFFQRLQRNHMDFSMAMGCAVFSMNVLVGVYWLLDSI